MRLAAARGRGLERAHPDAMVEEALELAQNDRSSPLPTAPVPVLGPPLFLGDADQRRNLRRPDIARGLFISVNTLRTHTKNIFAKLGVTSRRAAVTRAKELGLIG